MADGRRIPNCDHEEITWFHGQMYAVSAGLHAQSGLFRSRRGKAQERVHERFLGLLSGGSVEEWNLRKEPSTGAHDPQIFAGTHHSSTPDFICCMQAKRLWETCACTGKRGDEAHTHTSTHTSTHKGHCLHSAQYRDIVLAGLIFVLRFLCSIYGTMGVRR